MTPRFLLIFILCFSAFADDCPSVNLITEADSPFRKIPVYNQGPINICYAYSAAQILDWYQLKRGAGKRNIHPAWVALQYALRKNRSKLEIGHPKEAMESLRSSWNCDYETVETAVKSLGGDDETETKILSAVENGRYRLPANSSAVETLKNTLEKNCPLEKRALVMVPEVVRLNFTSLNEDSSYEKFLTTKFSASPSPVSIAYCANVWMNPAFDGISHNSRGQRDVVDKKCEYHESLIVGQKMLGNSCHFLVRNTWGNKWSGHNKNYSCVCRDRISGEFSEDCHPETHANDRFSVEACWVRSTDLVRNIGQVTFVK